MPRRPPRPRGERPAHPRAKRRFSQNFLVDPNMAEKIVRVAAIEPGETVVEVGPGTGALTRGLLERAGTLHAVEVDRELCEALRVEFASEPRLRLHETDILKVRLEDLAPEGPVTVVGNLPYAITSDLIIWMLDQHARIRRAVVLMQREVAGRLTAEPGERAAGSLTLAVRYRATSERILDVPPSCFRPVPKVHSSLVGFHMLASPAVRPRNERLFFRTIRAAFGERRKTLANALASGLGRPRPELEAAIEAAGLDSRIRGERLTLEDFCRLADALDSLPSAGGTPPVPEDA